MKKHHILEIHKKSIDKDGVFVKTLDQVENAIKFYEPQITVFLSPEMRVIIEDILSFEHELSFKCIGGYETAERQKIAIYPDYLLPPRPEETISAIRIQYQQKFNKLSHRDVLGAILGLGITRQRVGDIIVGDASIDVVADKEISRYVIASLEKVGRAGVKVHELALDALNAPVINYVIQQDTVKSLRLDSIVASGLKCSRKDAQQLITKELVCVNYRETANVSHTVLERDLISVRGKGRFILQDIEGTTKKERIRIILAHYPS